MQSYQLGFGLELADFDSSLTATSVLASLNGKHFQIQGLSAEILRVLGPSHMDFDRLVSSIQARDATVQTAEVRQSLDKLIEKNLVADLNAVAEAGMEKKLKLSDFLFKGYFVLRFPLFSHRVLLPLTSRLSAICHPTAMKMAIPLLLLVQFLFFHSSAQVVFRQIAKLDGHQLLYLLFFNYLALLIHELGHAAACVRSGIKHGVIGFAIYLVFPAFYTDVSETWKLPRMKRTLVDGAGVYFTLICATIAWGFWVWTANPVCAILTLMCDITVLANLNPFLRMDGYWLLSDVLGIPNMMAENRSLLKWMALRPLRLRVQRPAIFDLPGRLKAAYFTYFVLFFCFTLYFVTMFYFWYLPHLVTFYPSLVWAFSGAIRHSGFPDILLAGFRLVMNTIPILAPVLYLYDMVSKWVRKHFASPAPSATGDPAHSAALPRAG